MGSVEKAKARSKSATGQVLYRATSSSEPMPLSKEKIREIVSAAEKKRAVLEDNDLRRAAVLIPLYIESEQTHMLLTKRSDRVEHHKGQISFPGGMCDPTDETFLATALRETYEEIGIKPEDVEVLGTLDDARTSTGFLITPFVGLIPYPYPLKLSLDEVAEVIHVPLSFLLDLTNFKEERIEKDGTVYHIFSCSYKEHWIWGATAKIIKRFVELLSKGL